MMRLPLAGLALLVVTACGSGELNIVYDEPYCLELGENPDELSTQHCYLDQMFFFRPDGKVDAFFLAKDNLGFITRGNLDGDLFTLDDSQPRKLVNDQGHVRFAARDDFWLLRELGPRGHALKRLDADLQALEQQAIELPTGQPAFVDVPLCYEEEQFTNGRLDQSFNHCNGKNFTFFTSLGSIVSIDFEPLPPHGAAPDDELDPVWEVDHRNATWTLRGNVGVPDRYSDFSWSLSPEGYPQTARKRERQQRTGFQQPYNPNRLETALAYSFYQGADRDAAIEHYRTTVYPTLKRFELANQHLSGLQ